MDGNLDSLDDFWGVGLTQASSGEFENDLVSNFLEDILHSDVPQHQNSMIRSEQKANSEPTTPLVNLSNSGAQGFPEGPASFACLAAETSSCGTETLLSQRQSFLSLCSQSPLPTISKPTTEFSLCPTYGLARQPTSTHQVPSTSDIMTTLMDHFSVTANLSQMPTSFDYASSQAFQAVLSQFCGNKLSEFNISRICPSATQSADKQIPTHQSSIYQPTNIPRSSNFQGVSSHQPFMSQLPSYQQSLLQVPKNYPIQTPLHLQADPQHHQTSNQSPVTPQARFHPNQYQDEEPHLIVYSNDVESESLDSLLVSLSHQQEPALTQTLPKQQSSMKGKATTPSTEHVGFHPYKRRNDELQPVPGISSLSFGYQNVSGSYDSKMQELSQSSTEPPQYWLPTPPSTQPAVVTVGKEVGFDEHILERVERTEANSTLSEPRQPRRCCGPKTMSSEALASTVSSSDHSPEPCSQRPSIGASNRRRPFKACGSSFPDLASTIVICTVCAQAKLQSHNPATIKFYEELSNVYPSALSMCDLCGQHLLQQSSDPKPRKHAKAIGFRCLRCQVVFVRGDRLIAHSHFHTQKKAFQCTECSASFCRKHRLHEHCRSVHGHAVFLASQETV